MDNIFDRSILGENFTFIFLYNYPIITAKYPIVQKTTNMEGKQGTSGEGCSYPSWKGGEGLQLYRWRARNKSGKIFTGQLLACSDREVAEYVQKRHGYVTKIQKINNWYNYKRIWSTKKITNKSKENFFRQLSTLLNSGITLLRALEIIRNKSTGILAEICVNMEADLFKGLAFSIAMRKLFPIFNHTDVRIVEAGESSGNIAVLFAQLAAFYQKKVQEQRFLVNACIYPVIVLLLAGLTFMYFLCTVLPLLLDLYITMQVEPSMSLSILLFLGKAFTDFRWEFFFMLFILIWQIYKGREKWQVLLLKLPLIRSCYHDLLEVRYCRILSIMLSSGIALPSALKAAGETLSLEILRRQSEHLSSEVLQGMLVSKAAAVCSEIFDPTTLEFIAVGEESGNLAEMLMEAANITDKDLQAKLKNLKAMIEPILMVFIALLVGCIVFSITSPILGLMSGLPDYK